MIVNPQTLRGIYVGFNNLFNKALTTVAPLYTEVATVTPSTPDAETYAWLGDIPGMREWIGDGRSRTSAHRTTPSRTRTSS